MAAFGRKVGPEGKAVGVERIVVVDHMVAGVADHMLVVEEPAGRIVAVEQMVLVVAGIVQVEHIVVAAVGYRIVLPPKR